MTEIKRDANQLAEDVLRFTPEVHGSREPSECPCVDCQEQRAFIVAVKGLVALVGTPSADATTRQALERLTVAIEDVQRANDAWENSDGTRMTVTERDHIMAEAKIAVLDARRALTDTGGDTKEPDSQEETP